MIGADGHELSPALRLRRLLWAEQLALDFLKEHPERREILIAVRELQHGILALSPLVPLALRHG